MPKLLPYFYVILILISWIKIRFAILQKSSGIGFKINLGKTVSSSDIPCLFSLRSQSSVLLIAFKIFRSTSNQLQANL